MKKLVFSLLAMSFACSSTYAQNTFPASGSAGIGTTNPTVGALQINAPDKTVSSAIAIRQSNNPAYGFDLALDQLVDGKGYIYGVSNNTKTSLIEFDRTASVVRLPNLALGTGTPAGRFDIAALSGGQHSTGIIHSSGSQAWGHTLILATDAANGDDARLLFSYRNKAKQWGIGGQYSSTRFSIWEDCGDGFIGSTYGAERLTVASGGNVGIATSTPISLFQVDGGQAKACIGDAGGADLKYGTSYLGFNAGRSGSNWTINGDNVHNGAGVIYSTIEGEILFAPIGSTAGSDKTLTDANIASAINFKITPTGTYAKKITVQTTGFPDYVFKPTYKLRPLSEVKTYIDQNQHLPEVPAAATVEKEGMDIAEMNKLLLKKVEELTLYLVQQNGRLDEQQKLLKEQQQQIKKLTDQGQHARK
ncbi:hypothetical protein C8P68_11248 [Mucilaginibacter yixingensis]|uniref:Peptidase S74 domain-containing protein n=1 Tax=Mucilaginibacter yixingensis TaxID=1295612 RepID=A0A2T5J4L7_9SPHI|nr:hypothetical protein [Mucilaginibacter yixingensis]PTQ92448.1 hypothetical protein C8P68_11248 [Mucilaginibacter yixingensis]